MSPPKGDLEPSAEVSAGEAPPSRVSDPTEEGQPGAEGAPGPPPGCLVSPRQGGEVVLHPLDMPGFRRTGPSPALSPLLGNPSGVWVPETERESSSLQGPPLCSFKTGKEKKEAVDLQVQFSSSRQQSLSFFREPHHGKCYT